MAGPSSSVPWADVDALFADLPGMGIPIGPDAAHQASEGYPPQSFEDMLAGGVDFLGAQADAGGSPQMLDAPRPDVGAPPELYIDPALLALPPPQPTGTLRGQLAAAEEEIREEKIANQVLRDLLAEADEKIEGLDEQIEDLNDKVGVLTLRLDKYEGPDTGDVVQAFQDRIARMSEAGRRLEGEVDSLRDLTNQQRETIETLQGKVASYASVEETFKSQVESYTSAAQASEKRLGDLNRAQEETIKTLEGKLASYASAEETIKSQIDHYTSEAQAREKRLEDLNKTQEEKIKTLESKVASHASAEGTIKSQIDSYKSAAEASDKHFEDLKQRQQETLKTLESQVARKKSQDQTIKSQQAQINEAKSAAQASEKRLKAQSKHDEETVKTLEARLANLASAEQTIKSQKQQLDSYKSAAKAGDEHINQQREKIKTLEAQAANYNSAEEKMKSQQHLIEKYKEGETQGNQTLSRYRDTINDQKAALNEQKNAADDLKAKYEQVQMMLEDRKANYNELQSAFEQQHEANDSKDEQIRTQNERIRELTNVVKQHLASIKMAEEEVTRLCQEKEEREGSHRHQRKTLKAKLEKLDPELEATREELDAAREEVKKLQVDSREKGYTIQRLEESQGSYVKAYNENLDLQEALRAQDEDMEALKGDLQDLEEEIAKLRKGRREGSSRSESRDGERERVPGVGGYTTLEGIFGEEDEEDGYLGGEPAGPAGTTGTGAGPNADGGMEEDEETGGEVNVGGDEGVGGQVEEEEETTRPAAVELVERIVEVPTMVFCPWLWWKMPYQAFMLLLVVGGFPSVSAVFWKFVGYHLFVVNWPLVKLFGRRIEVAPHSPRPQRLPPPAKVLMLLAWHLVVYASIGTLLWQFSGTMAERTMWLRANDLSRATLIGLRESLRQSTNNGNPVVRFTLRLLPNAAKLENVAGRWLPGSRGVFG